VQPYKSNIENIIYSQRNIAAFISSGWTAITDIILNLFKNSYPEQKNIIIGFDGYLSNDWLRIIDEITLRIKEKKIHLSLFDVRDCMKSKKDIDTLIDSSLPEGEPVFGKKYKGGMDHFYSKDKLLALASALKLAPGKSELDGSLTICYGPGSLLAPLSRIYDLAFYFDLTREEALKRNKAWTDKKSKTQTIGPRRIYYVDFPVYDRQRKRAFPYIDYYIDTNDNDNPKILGKSYLLELIDEVVKSPLRIKPLYEPGVWGGQWLKRNRGLPDSMINCAYGLEIIAPEQSILAVAGGTCLELPFNLLMENSCDRIMGTHACRRYRKEFPIRVAYDDTWEGANLSIQDHPTSKYMKSYFNENLHQAEMYYIFDTYPDSIVHLGLKEDADKEEFLQAARKSEAERKPFDHTRFVNVLPAKKGSIYLIPPGTVHGAGANELVLEISSTSYRYTFKIYDYCRPDLDGTFRPIHIDHAFNVIKFFRKEKWVSENLTPEPKEYRKRTTEKGSWTEYTLADRREFYHIVHRVEFDSWYEDTTDKGFHILNLVEGDIVSVRSLTNPEKTRDMAMSETVLLPKAVGPYEVINKGKKPCKIVKVFLRV